jgi:hypothetical protein
LCENQPHKGNLAGELVLETSMNEMRSWKLAIWVGLALLVLKGPVKDVFELGSLSYE